MLGGPYQAWASWLPSDEDAEVAKVEVVEDAETAGVESVQDVLGEVNNSGSKKL